VFAACLPSSCLYFRERERVERVSKHNDNNNKDERKRVREKVVFFAKPHLAKLSNDYLYTDHSRSTQTLKEHKIKRKSIISTKCIRFYTIHLCVSRARVFKQQLLKITSSSFWGVRENPGTRSNFKNSVAKLIHAHARDDRINTYFLAFLHGLSLPPVARLL
jgi:hypothetical protein